MDSWSHRQMLCPLRQADSGRGPEEQMRAVAPNAVRRRRRQHAPGPRRTCFPPDRRSPCRDDPHRECELRAGPARASLSSRHMGKVLRTFESRLSVKPEEAWNWMTSAEGISTELSPILKMTM